MCREGKVDAVPGQGLQSQKRSVVWLTGLALVACVLLTFPLGRYPISLKEVTGILSAKLFHIEPFWDARMETVLWNVRMPRILLSMLVGASLSAAGAAYQGLFQNPMASPDILGASAGAGFGAALAILLGAASRMVTASAFAFGMLTVAIVWLASRMARGNRVLTLVLSGIMVSSVFQAGTSFVKLVADPSNQLPAITYWLMGSLSGARREDVLIALIPITIGLLPLLLLRFRINLLTLGDAEARTMGVPVGLLRLVLIAGATLATAAAVSVSGTIGWVGLLVPHTARRLVGNDYRYLMPESVLLGALFLLIIDTISRNLLATEIPLGILTALIGAPFFLVLIARGGERY